jgi:hypothetical protein
MATTETDDFCPAEYPDPDNLGFIGHLCNQPAGHDGQHTVVIRLGSRDATARWNAAPGGVR